MKRGEQREQLPPGMRLAELADFSLEFLRRLEDVCAGETRNIFQGFSRAREIHPRRNLGEWTRVFIFAFCYCAFFCPRSVPDLDRCIDRCCCLLLLAAAAAAAVCLSHACYVVPRLRLCR